MANDLINRNDLLKSLEDDQDMHRTMIGDMSLPRSMNRAGVVVGLDRAMEIVAAMPGFHFWDDPNYIAVTETCEALSIKLKEMRCVNCDAYGGTRDGTTTRNTCLNEDSPVFMTKVDLARIEFGCVFGCAADGSGRDD
jgi:hypothetical protein